ncbi:hypothetical protein [Granulicella sibirica]|uniref:Uncharacterized protein n=1 Tax=Granulicella sibirica TaxID=2479048 RepID=A0A4Q0ST32_9BACT|nr:hypothetical protein [Granulicella sibirica]RXH54073.1 hypothetical protein GRAN_5042 [Granulicella sibirica]
MWHWTDGEIGDKTQYVKVDLQSGQVAEAERLTSVLEDTPRDDPDSGISVQDIGEHDIEGIRANGVRTTTIHLHGTDKPEISVREVWTSAPMRLVLKVVDTSPGGEMTVSGLEHISLSPDTALFRPPVERILRHWKDGGVYAKPDLECLTTWMVR